MNNKIVNKQIPLKSIIDVANYLENYKDDYLRKFQIDENRNKNIPFGEKVLEYENGSAEIRYTVEFHNGKSITETDYNWFIGNINEPRIIKCIRIDLSVSYFSNINKNSNTNEYNRINAYVEFQDCGMNLKYSDASVSVETTNKESEAHNIYSEIMNILENNEDRYNKTLKYRKLRIQCFTISIGIILSYILFVVLKINASNLPQVINEYLSNKYVLVFGQWFVAILLGNIFSYWYILSVYRPLLPETKYAGYNSSTYKSVYKDDIEDYLEHSEVHFGKFWDAEQRRTKIEKLYKITNKIILVQLLISIILFFILK